MFSKSLSTGLPRILAMRKALCTKMSKIGQCKKVAHFWHFSPYGLHRCKTVIPINIRVFVASHIPLYQLSTLFVASLRSCYRHCEPKAWRIFMTITCMLLTLPQCSLSEAIFFWPLVEIRFCSAWYLAIHQYVKWWRYGNNVKTNLGYLTITFHLLCKTNEKIQQKCATSKHSPILSILLLSSYFIIWKRGKPVLVIYH